MQKSRKRYKQSSSPKNGGLLINALWTLNLIDYYYYYYLIPTLDISTVGLVQKSERTKQCNYYHLYFILI